MAAQLAAVSIPCPSMNGSGPVVHEWGGESVTQWVQHRHTSPGTHVVQDEQPLAFSWGWRPGVLPAHWGSERVTKRPAPQLQGGGCSLPGATCSAPSLPSLNHKLEGLGSFGGGEPGRRAVVSSSWPPAGCS